MRTNLIVMIALLGLGCAPSSPIEAEFLIDMEMALETDNRIGSSVCGFDKQDYQRLYWYEYVAKSGRYQIDISRVRFAVIDNAENDIQRAASLPLKYEDEQEGQAIVAIGTYDWGEEIIADILCFR